jgi:NAD(P)-dependent dehydrogenase (short-subunit alcohol dehydrogenase family)
VSARDPVMGKPLAGRAAVVTGRGRGIGATAALALGQAGAIVAVAARNREQVVEEVAQLRSRGIEAYAFRCDVTSPRHVRDLVLSAVESMGKVDVLVNNAGTARSNPLAKVTLSEWSHIMAVNATGTFLCTQAMIHGMVERGWGRVVNVASVAGLVGARYVSAYTASKHAVVGFTRAVAAEVEGTGVTVNAVCPGYVDTPLTDETVARIVRRTGKTAEEVLRALLAGAGQGRLIRAQEVAERILHLCLDGAADTNGASIVIDGKGLEP